GTLAPDGQGHLAARLDRRDDPRQLARRVHFATVGLDDDVAHFDTRLTRRLPLRHRVDERATELGKPERVGGLLADLLDLDANLAARHLALFLDLIGSIHRDVDGDGEGEPHETAASRIDERVDADDLAFEIE